MRGRGNKVLPEEFDKTQFVDTANLLGNNINSTQAKKVISTILDISLKSVNNAFKSSSKWSKSSIITIYKKTTSVLDIKVVFNFLKAEQSWNVFLSYCKDMKLAKPSLSFKRGVESLRYLTPVDFAAVTRQNRFRPITDVKDFIQRLEDEIAIKNVSTGNVMGFLAS